jgi:hypothetical protein
VGNFLAQMAKIKNNHSLGPLHTIFMVRYGNQDVVVEPKWVYVMWRTLIEHYSKLQLTFESDKLPAVADLTTLFALFLEDEFLAGIWRSDLLLSLMWRSVGEVRSPKEYTAPSWSWACLKSPIETWSWHNNSLSTLDIDHTFLVSLIDYRIETIGGNCFGKIGSGFLKLRGPLKRVQWDKGCSYIVLNEQQNPRKVNLKDCSFDLSRERLNFVRRTGDIWALLLFEYSSDAAALLLKCVDEEKKIFRRVGVAWVLSFGFVSACETIETEIVIE